MKGNYRKFDENVQEVEGNFTDMWEIEGNMVKLLGNSEENLSENQEKFEGNLRLGDENIRYTP